MFNKINCPNCRKKIKKTFDFCPSCGTPISNKESDWGMLGTDDFEDSKENPLISGFTNFPMNSGILDKMLGSTMKLLEKQLKEIQNQENQKNQNTRHNFELYINGKRIDPSKIKVSNQPVSRFVNNKEIKKSHEKRPIKKYQKYFSENKAKQFSKMEKNEPLTNVRRLSDKVIYEINMPEVNSIRNIEIVQTSNTIEIKAISKNKAYFKSLPVNLPLKNKKFHKGKLFLELDARD